MASLAQLDPDSAELKKRIERFQTVRDNILGQVRQVIVGQEEVLDQILISLFVGGHCPVAFCEVVPQDMRTREVVYEAADSSPPDDAVQPRINLIIDGDGQLLGHGLGALYVLNTY